MGNYSYLTPEAATQLLANCVSEALAQDEYHQFYYEEVEVFLKHGADPTDTENVPSGTPSILAAVLHNNKVRENVALRSAELLCKALQQKERRLNPDELALLEEREARSTGDLRHRWGRLRR